MSSVRFATALTAVLLLVGMSCSGGDHVRNLDEKDFGREVLGSSTPTVVEFWAHGCLPCIALARPLDRVAREYQGRVAFWKLNAGWTARTRELYDFHAVPTLIFYRDGREVGRQVGRPEGDDYEGLVRFVEAGLGAQ